jgi:dTDP-3-amino-3,4,6-trideoxy-alpha-D-glucose transaminase
MVAQNDFTRQWEAVGPRVLEVVERVGRSGRYVLGKEVAEFERALAEYCGLRHAIGVGNGMDALEIALRCLDIRADDKVLTTPFSAFATTLAIFRAGGTPVFVDVDDNGNIDLKQCREVLIRDRSIRFCLPVHLYGNPVDLDKLAALRTDFNLRLVEDCAQAIGARSRGRVVGTAGQAAGMSFYPTKNLGGYGDGGAILTNDANIAARARTLRNYGQSDLYAHEELGLNSRLDELQAAILREALLRNLEAWTEARRRQAASYHAQIRPLHLTLLKSSGESEPVWHLFPIFTTHRERFREFLRAADIQTGIHYPRVIPDQPAFQRNISAEIAVEPSNARRLANSEVSLPIHPFLREDEISEVIRACNAFAP